MSDHATVKLEGTIVGNPVLAWRPDGDPVMQFRIAVRRKVQSDILVNRWTDYFNVKMAGDEAVKTCKELKRRSVVKIEGYLRQQRHKLPRGERSGVYIEAVTLDRCEVSACS